MDDDLTAAAFRRAFRDADGVEPMPLPDGEVVDSLGSDIGPLRDALRHARWLHVTEQDTGGAAATLAAWPSTGVQVNFFFGWGAPIAFDFDLRQLIGDEDVRALARLLRLVSSVVGKDVVVRPEGERDGQPVLVVEASTGRFRLLPAPREPR